MPRHALAWGIPLSLFVVLSGCPGESPKDGAVRVVIDYPDFTPGCVKVTATDEGGGESVSETLIRDALVSKTSATIAVFRKPSWGTRLSLSVESYEVSCDGAVLERFSTPEPLSVSSTSGVQEWKVQLAAIDADKDGFAAAGTDCDDARDDVHPGAAELCGAVDIDCDGATGCADTGCEGRPCDDQNACTTGDSCQGGTCAATPVTCTTPPGFCFVDVGACAQGQCQYAIVDAGTPCPLGTDGGLCANDGTCVPPSVEFDCSNGTDDDGDKKVDCADTDCGAKPCNDGNACTLSDTCQGTTCTGAPMTCTPSSQCMSAGCVNGACQEQPAVDAGCSDGLGCTLNDRCDATGACVGQTDCSTPPGTGCYQPTGTCTVQGCSYPVNKGAACNDSNLCTVADVCAPNGSCSGTAYSCNSPPQCFSSGACVGDGGCAFAPNPGAACAVNTFAGACDADGGCFAPGAAFGYAPKNFAPGNLAPAGGVTLAGCNVVFDSTSKTFVNGCGSAGLPAISEVTLSNTRKAVVLSMRSLVLESSASLTLLGDKPVIVAVYGNATVNGALSAYSRTNGTALQGAGMNPPECAAGEGLPGVADTGGAGGGGGAGYGLFGADGGSGGGGTGVPGGGGAQTASPSPEPLRGGCRGGDGANTGAGPGGNGGGAVQLSVAGTLTLNAPVSASGAGGAGASGNNSSGGGGGSGGTVVVEAASLVFGNNAALTANGGGGGGGAKSATANNGSDGTAATGAQAGGGNGEGGGSGGGKGGSGGSAQGAATVGVSAARGGGGGGGAVGFIYVRAANAGGCSGTPSVASPPPQYVNCP